MLYDLASRVLFLMGAERSHEMAISVLRHLPAGLAGRLFGSGPAPSPVRLMGIDFPNPVGLAAGLDKNAECVDALGALGFGFIEVGTVTPRPQVGNPRPRMFRLIRERAIINRLGFNNLGVHALAANLQRASYSGVLGVNIGKNADTPNERALDDYVTCLRAVYGLADYVTVNISSPNTRNLRELQSGAALDSLLSGLRRARSELEQRHGRHMPLVVKIAPDLEREQVEMLARITVETGMDGVIAANTTITRENITSSPHAGESGGLSGAPLLEQSNRVIGWLHAALAGALPIIGAGGVLSGKDAQSKRAAGADLIQLYSGLIYRGPGLIRECVEALRHA